MEFNEIKLREQSLASVFEIKELIVFLNKLNEDEPLAYSITSKLIDFFAEYFYNKTEADGAVVEYLVKLYESNHKHIREKISKALMKLMNKNYKLIRRVIVLAYNKEGKSEHFTQELDAMASTVFSGIYFDYSHISEAREELEQMRQQNDADEENQDNENE